MGVLVDGPSSSRRRGGEGQRFLDAYWSMDDDDRALIRKWRESGVPMVEIARRILDAGFDLGRSTVEHGVKRLEADGWAC